MYLTLLTIVFFIFLLYALKEYLTYWEKNGVPQYTVTKILKDHLIALTKGEALALVFHSYCTSFQNKRYFGIYQLFKRSLVVHDPKLVKKITVTDFDHFVDHELFSTGNDPLWDRNMFALHGVTVVVVQTIDIVLVF
ncbi:hypothetical protein FQR65_LT01430 [Abscondita terminalis]|nr:hypothetical protein FQR65_LT01430 [Abscondita terminalis]